MLTTMKEILDEERKNRRAAGSFTVWSIDACRAVINAAERLNRPVIIMCSPYELKKWGMEELAAVMLLSAKKAGVPVAVHLDHGDSYEIGVKALENGFTSVMIDASHLPLEQNIEITRKIVKQAERYGATVEAELGRVGGAELDIFAYSEEMMQTDPDEARTFYEETGIDALAVGIGTVHGFYKSRPNLNMDRLKKISELVPIPLVLHGGSGIPDQQIREAIENGIAKINICTEFIGAFSKSNTYEMTRENFKYSTMEIYEAYSKAVLAGEKVAEDKIRLFGCGHI